MTGLPGRGRRKEGDSGAVLVEFALIAPLLILITIAIFEFGFAFFEYLTVERSVNEGARTAAFAGTQGGPDDNDCAAVGAAAETLLPSMLDRIDRVEVFRADDDGSPLVTNVWTVDETETSTTVCGGVHWIVPSPYPWLPSDRQTDAPLDSGDPDLDLIGVRVVLDRGWITGLGPFSGTYQIDETSLIRIEPELYQDP